MRIVFNYRKALREPKMIRQVTDYFSLPFPIELIPAINFLVFFGLTFAIGYLIRQEFPYAFANTWFVFLAGIPLLFTILVKKIKPEGKNIYVYIYDYCKYLITIKIPKKVFCHDNKVEFLNDRSIQFADLVEVVDRRNGEVKNTNESNQEQYVINERGRRVRLLSYKKQVDSDSK